VDRPRPSRRRLQRHPQADGYYIDSIDTIMPRSDAKRRVSKLMAQCCGAATQRWR